MEINTLFNRLKARYKKASIVEKLIYINVAVFILGYLLNTIAFLMNYKSNFVFDWFALPANFSELLFKPWTLITYAFVHAGLFHILSNLLVLYYIGNLFLDFFSTKRFIQYYFSGIIVGGLLFMISYNYFPALKSTSSYLVGASAAVTAIFAGIATYIPNYEIKFRFIGFVKLGLLAIIWIAFDIVQIPAGNAGGHLSHLGGALIGFILTKHFMGENHKINWFKFFKREKKSTLKTVFKNSKKTKNHRADLSEQQKINFILDKISKSGYHTLSKEEKDFLFSVGKK